MVGGDAVLCLALVKSGAFVAGAELELAASSATLKLMISTMLDTSFLMFSGSELGRDFPVSFRLHRYMARANSGKCS